MADARDAEDSRLLAAEEYPRLLAAYYPVVLERCRLRFDDPDAFEVAHAVMLRLLTELRRGKTYSVPFRVVVHQVTTWKIKEFLARGGDQALPEGWEPESGEDPFVGIDEEHDLGLLFDGLPPRVREVMSLRYLGGLEIGEIADRLGIARNAVDQALHRGHATIRERFA